MWDQFNSAKRPYAEETPAFPGTRTQGSVSQLLNYLSKAKPWIFHAQLKKATPPSTSKSCIVNTLNLTSQHIRAGDV